MGVGNSLALAALGHNDQITDDSAPALRGAQVGRDFNGRLNGLLQEGAAPPLSTLLRELPKGRLLNVLSSARDEYLAAGVTTLQNGYADIPSMYLLLWARRLGLLPQRVVVWPAHDKVGGRISITDNPSTGSTPSTLLSAALGWSPSHPASLSVSAVKLIADGSPQGRTAWLTEAYLADDQLAPGYRGFPTQSTSSFKDLVRHYHSAGFQLALHGNGDASIDLIIDALNDAQQAVPRNDARHILVHAQTVRADQLEKLAALNASVSFFPTHTYFWGDWYRLRVLGEARAQQISPLATADQFSVRYTVHSDAPVTPMDPMQMLWSATTRQTLSGKTLGPDLVVSRARVLRAMTLDAAWQNHLDQDRGSLETGKLADLIVLSGDPLLAEDVRRLHVLQVWIGGREVYRRSAAERK